MRRFLMRVCTVLFVCGLLSINDANSAGYNLNLTLNGDGDGSVNSLPSGTISCTYSPQSGTCSSTLSAGTSLSLLATPGSNSFFGGWGGSCSKCYDLNCPLILDSDMNCAATFSIMPPLMIEGVSPAYYTVLQDAFNTTPNSPTKTIRSRDIAFYETVTVNSPVTVFLQGGYDALFSTQTGYSVLNGKLSIQSGSVVVDRIVLSASTQQPPSVPTNVQATAASPNQIDLTWAASTDNVGVTGYGVYRAGVFLGTTTDTSFSDIGLAASSNYCYAVYAYNRAGKISGLSTDSCVTTQAPTNGKVVLDSNGIVQSTITVTGPGGSQLTLYAGTRVALPVTGGGVQPPASLNNIYLSLVNDTGSLPSLQAGITPLAQLRIVLTIDGVEHDALFWPTSTSATMQQGLKLVAVVSNQNLVDGTLGMLFAVKSGKAVHVGTSVLTKLAGTASRPALIARSVAFAATGSGSSQGSSSPTSTGSHIVGGSSPGGAASAPAGAFWSSFTIPDRGCVTVGTLNFCGPFIVDSLFIREKSTEQVLGECNFGQNNIATTGPHPDGSQFWCERGQTAADGTSEIKIYSMQANLPWIHVTLVRASDTYTPIWTFYQPPTGGLHGPDGTIYSDPYQHKEFKFAGFKKFIFTSSEERDMDFWNYDCVSPFQDAGYEVNNDIFNGHPFNSWFGVSPTLDARVRIEEVILKDKRWTVRNGPDTQGNKGTYQYKGKYKGTAKATLKSYPMPFLPQVKIWENSADVTFERDPSRSTPDVDFYTTTGGTVTQTVYTVPDPTGVCYGIPASFTDTYPIYKKDGYLGITRKADPMLYNVGASITSSAPVTTHQYKYCCKYQNPPCVDQTMQIGEQQHPWLFIGPYKVLPVPADYTLKGSFSDPSSGSYEWNLSPVE